MQLKLIRLLGVILLLLPPRYSSAEEEQLSQLRERIRVYEEKLAQVRKTGHSLTKQQGEIRREVLASDEELSKAQMNLADLRLKTDLTRKQISTLEKDFLGLDERLRVRLVAIYKAIGRGGSNFGSYRSIKNTDLSPQATYYLTAIQRADWQLLREISKKKSEHESALLNLEEIEEKQSVQISEISEKRARLEAILTRYERLKSSISQHEDSLREVLSGLSRGAGELDQWVSNLSEGESGSGGKTQFSGLRPNMSGIIVPVVGKIVADFGRHKVNGVADFRDMVFQKGLEYRASDGSNVSAIHVGRVLYVGKIPAFGQVVIIDHGLRYYSLYGRLRSISVKVGDTVVAGDVVGKLGAVDERGSNFYFEIRKNGKAVNPRQYL